MSGSATPSHDACLRELARIHAAYLSRRNNYLSCFIFSTSHDADSLMRREKFAIWSVISGKLTCTMIRHQQNCSIRRTCSGGFVVNVTPHSFVYFSFVNRYQVIGEPLINYSATICFHLQPLLVQSLPCS